MSYSLVHHGKDKILLNGREYAFGDFLKVCGDYSVPWGFPTRVYERGKQVLYHRRIESCLLVENRCAGPWCSQEPELAMLVMRLRAENRE